jgi:exosortase
VGLYYLYLNRDELFRAKVRPLLGNQFSKARTIGGVVFAGVAAAIYVAAPLVPQLAGNAEIIRQAASGMALLGVLALLLDWGLATLFIGLLTFGYGIFPGQNDWVKDMGMLITLFGIVLTLSGWGVMKIAWFPLVFLVCAIPWPGLVYSKVAGPLQQLAATVAVGTLQLTGVEAERIGTKIVMGNGLTQPFRTLNVAEACAGLRSLMTFISVGGAVAFLSNRPLWQKIIITLSAIPIAIFCNVMRVAGQGLLDHYWSHEVSEGFAHQFVGLVMLVPAFFLILLVGWLLDQIFVEEVEEPGPLTIKVSPRSAAAAPVSAAATTPQHAQQAQH